MILLAAVSASWISALAIDYYRFKGPKYIDPQTERAIEKFNEKCVKYSIENVCKKGFENLVSISIVDKIYYRNTLNFDIRTIGLAEFSFFTNRTKISIDRSIDFNDKFLDSTIIHELGHAILDLDHDNSKVKIMNSSMPDLLYLEMFYDEMINEMFEDFIKMKKKK